MRKLATIDTIHEIREHENADALDLAFIRGWQVVVKKNEFKPGDRCVYVEIDSVLPDRPEFEFMRPRGFRVRTAKFRGELSQGIVFPLSILEGLVPADTEWREGDDVTTELGVTLYTPPIPACLAGDVVGLFPRLIPKTDCERIQNHAWLIDLENIAWLATEKLDGSSVSVWYDDILHVCSRNWELKEDDRNAYWIAAKKLNLAEKLKDYKIALQGELLGPKIQGNRYGLADYTIYFFDAWNMLENRYLQHDEFFDLCYQLNLSSVPQFYTFASQPRSLPKLENLLIMAEGKSVLNPKVEREGLVFKPNLEMTDPRIGRVAFKAISNKFLLRGE